MEVTGTDHNQVDSLFTVLKDKLEYHTTWFGGIRTRIPLCAFVGLGFFVIALVPQGVVRIGFNRGTLAISLGYATLLGWWLLPLERWLPGFAVYSGDASFIIRNTAYITFAGLIATLIIPLIGFYWKKGDAKPIPEQVEHINVSGVDAHSGWTGKCHHRNTYRFDVQNVGSSLKLYCYMWTPKDCFGEVILESPSAVRTTIAKWDESSTRNHTLLDGCGAGNSGVSSTQDDLIQRTPLRDCLIVDLADRVHTTGSYKVEFRYTRGANGTWIQRVEVRS